MSDQPRGLLPASGGVGTVMVGPRGELPAGHDDRHIRRKMDIEIPDNEDAACALDMVEARLVNQGQYQFAGDVIGAKMRLRADAEEIARLESENERLRKGIVWCVQHEAGVAGDDDVYLMWGDNSVKLSDDDNVVSAVLTAMGEG